MPHLTHDRPELLARIRRIGGQIKAIENGLTTNRPCGELLHLIAAVRGAMNGLMDEVIAEHIDEHVAKPGLTNAARAQAATELKTAMRRYAK